MVKSKKLSLSEYTINNILTQKLREKEFIVMNRVRLSPAEFDLIVLIPGTCQLINIEIKKNQWQKLFHQALRGKLYCHFSIIMVPSTAKSKIDTDYLSNEGIGLIYYEELEGDVNLIFEIPPQQSDSINRNLKKLLYREIKDRFGELIYA
jgi:hypothetical protein